MDYSQVNGAAVIRDTLNNIPFYSH